MIIPGIIIYLGINGMILGFTYAGHKMAQDKTTRESYIHGVIIILFGLPMVIISLVKNLIRRDKNEF